MECPHLFVKDEVKICKRMVEMGVDAHVTDFDVQHYCHGNPINCYYFRTSEKQSAIPSEKTLKDKLSQIFTTT
jgi:hypothetical protein